MSPHPDYLLPYIKATQKHGSGFPSLLWASPSTQSARFEAIRKLYRFRDSIVADVGCGRADFLDHLLARNEEPNHYVGIEAVDTLADAAERKHHPNCTILRADFVREPVRLFVGADVVVISGALNTLNKVDCLSTIRRAFDAATYCLIFNFLSSTLLAGNNYLTWHEPTVVKQFAKTLSDDVTLIEGYLAGDATIAMRKSPD